MSNPFEAPRASSAGIGALGPEWTVSDAFNVAWARCGENWPALLGSMLTLMFGYGLLIVALAVWAMVGRHTPDSFEYRLATFAMTIVITFVAPAVMAGLNRLVVAVARGEHPGIDVLFSGLDRYPQMLGFQLLIGGPGLAIAAIQLAAPPDLVPLFGVANFAYAIALNLFFALGGLFAPFLIVDQGLGPVAALGASWSRCEGRRATTLLLMLANVGIVLLGALACGIGMIPAAPLAYVMNAVAYDATFRAARGS